MTLFSTAAEEASPAARLRAAHAFVSQTIAYAEAEIATRSAAGRDPAEWQSYLRFQRHTLRELEDGTLDGWFGAGASGA